MTSTKKAARVAGLLYVLMSIPGFFSIMYVPGKLIVSGNAAATAHNILASEMLFRMGIASELIGAAGFIFVVWALYRLLNGVNKTHALLMFILGVVSIPIMFLNELNQIAALALFHGADYLAVFDKPRLDALGMLFLDLRGQGFVVAEIFWGLWLFPLGLLVYKSRFLPRFLGVLLIAACFGYLADSFTSLLLPSYGDLVGRFARILMGAGELSTMAWLLIMGAKDQPLDAPA
jgi:hypothetical protein